MKSLLLFKSDSEDKIENRQDTINMTQSFDQGHKNNGAMRKVTFVK